MRLPLKLLWLSRSYVAIALLAAGVFSPLVYAPIPWLVLLAYIYLEFGAGPARFRVPLHLFLTLSLPLFFKPLVGVWASPAVALPVISLLDHGLRQFALSQELIPAGEGRRPSRLFLMLALSLLAVGLMALALGSWGLLLSCAVVAGYLVAVVILVLRRTSVPPAQADVVSCRALAGDLTRIPVKLTNRARLAGQLSLSSLYPWFHLIPARLVTDKETLEVETSFAPPLAGPTRVAVWASFLDPWGLLRVDFSLEMLELFVIPRARYAEWLARRYLEMSRSGGQEAMASATPVSPRASRKGMEFYGLRLYQPGDSAKVIDWKHTLKMRQVIVKEFLDTGVEAAILAVNLSVTDEEERDELAYSLISTALTLARENIPSALAAYSHQGVVATTQLLDPRRALLQALGLAREIRVSLSPLRYLDVPDVTRLRGNLFRLRQSGGGAATRLAKLLQMEHAALTRAALENPATEALSAALAVVKRKVNVVILSGHNHDTEALAFNEYALKERGYKVLQVELESRRWPLARAVQQLLLT